MAQNKHPSLHKKSPAGGQGLMRSIVRGDVDHEGYIDEPSPRRHVGKIGDPEPVGRRGVELAVYVIERARSAVSPIVVRTGLPRITPCKPQSRINRATLHRAISNPSAAKPCVRRRR
jgi:hypothetical protein